MGPLSIEQVLAAEAEAIHGATRKAEVAALRKLAAAQSAETQRADKDADQRSGRDEQPEEVARRKAFYRGLNALERAALCLSGGGIRSATFSLGVIQALAMHGLPLPAAGASNATKKSTATLATEANRSLLSCFHYLSTVSGGGYIGSWLSAWRNRNDFPTVWQNLVTRPDGPDVEPAEISWLRAYSSYLTPKVGIFSADTWSAAAIFLRNLLLNWLVIVPAVAMVLVILKIIVTVSVGVARIEDAWWLHYGIALIGIACLIVAQAFTTAHRPTRRELPDMPAAAATGNIDQDAFLRGSLLSSLISAILLTSFLTSQVGVDLARNLSTYAAIAIAAGFGVAIYAGGWLAGWPLRWDGKDFGRWALSGLVYGGLLAFGAHLYMLLSPYTDAAKGSIWVILVPVILGVPWVLLSQLLAEMIFVGLVSYEANSDADREWLGRGAGWIAAAAVIWALTTFISFAGGHFLIDVESWLGPYIASAGGVAGIVGALIGKSSQTAAMPVKAPGAKAIIFKIVLAIAGPIFAAVLVVSISVGLDLLLLGDSLVQGLSKFTLTTAYVLFWLVIGLIATGFVAAVASRSVNINRFSLHALYRNRLVRAYLGASRQQRCPDLFTGFDNDDNLPAHALWPPKLTAKGQNTFCLFHVVNITLNVVKASRLAWQQRKAESFTVSPLHCGTAYKGFRSSFEYGGPGKPFGLSLGTAMAISGAAASPNMGYHSSPSITLLLALFNVRLGWWLGNPGVEGETTYKDEGPSTAIVPLAQETFGLTTDQKKYVYLSDGGHFENLGLYEMVRRRCRFIVAVDAGCDPDFAFEDLGNAVRKIYIDLGVRIRFSGLDKLKNRPTPEQLKEANYDIPYHAFGTIGYADADDGGEDGVILYIKPAVHGTDDEGAGVRSYAAAHRTFPHEPTADQWFNESQFESYRSLGLDIVNTVLRGRAKPNQHTLAQILQRLAPTVHP